MVFCQINSWLTGRRLVSLPFSDHCELLVDTQEDLDAVLSHLLQTRDVYSGALSGASNSSQKNASASEPRPLGFRPFSTTSRSDGKNRYVELRPIDAKPGTSTGFATTDTYFLHIVDLSPGPEALFRTFHKDSVQRKIRRAERETLAYESGNSQDLLEKFYRLLLMTRRRQHNPPQPISWFQNLSRTFGNALQVRVASSREGQPLASILTLKHRSTITYKYGCSDPRFSNLGGTALLFWRTIQEATHEGFAELDLGRSTVDNQGLIAFKEHWGARRATLKYWRFPERRQPEESTWKNSLKSRLVDVAPDWCLVAAGKFLYPHIG